MGMKERPIIFSAPMVRAILEGRKTQTRRILKDGKIRFALRDRLWVRESFQLKIDGGALYYATAASRSALKWKPSIHMPQSLSRITLEVTAVEVERLQSISEEDAKAEGMKEFPCLGPHRGASATFWSGGDGKTDDGAAFTPRGAFERIWSKINGDASWDANPWVVAITFKRVA